MTAEAMPCGCCAYCGALPGHQNPPTGQVWQHRHAPVREQMAEPHPSEALHHRIEWELSPDWISGRVLCAAPEGAPCRLTCAARLCEEWPREGCEHGMVDAGYCNVVEFIENGDSIQSAYIGAASSLRSGFIVPTWQGDFYGWEYQDERVAMEAMAQRLSTDRSRQSAVPGDTEPKPSGSQRPSTESPLIEEPR